MLIRFDRVAAATLSTLALTSRPVAATSSCSWNYDSFTSLDNNTYAVGQCGYSSKLDHMRRAFVSHCNATAVGFHDAGFWHIVDVWYPVYLQRKEHEANDTTFVACLNQFHKSAAPKSLKVASSAVMLSAIVFAYGLS